MEMRCSKVVICNRSRASGHEFNGCNGGDEARKNCPDWITALALKYMFLYKQQENEKQ